MSEKPKKRLVSKGRYVQTIMGKGGLYSVGISLYASTPVLLCISLFCLVVGYVTGSDPDGFDRTTMFILCGCFLALAVGTLWCGTKVFDKAAKIEEVTPLTKNNTGDLPETETLVRASDLPPSDQQAELLRAALPSSKSPPEELLRATQNRQED